MNIIFMLIGFSLLIAICFLAAFFWAVNSGQYEDPQTPAMRMLFEPGQNEETEQNDFSEHRHLSEYKTKHKTGVEHVG